MVNNIVKVRVGRSTFDFGDGSRLKSDIALSTDLSPDKINEIVDRVRFKLSELQQPVHRHDIATTTHFVMLEMGYKLQGDSYIQFIKERHDSINIPKEKLKYIKCKYCNTSNDSNNNFCVGCGATLNKDDTKSKII